MKRQLSAPAKRRSRIEPPMVKYHSQMKVLVEDVALWRLMAAERSLPRGWIELAAEVRGVSPSTVTMAIGGHTWKAMTDPPPVPPNSRSMPGTNRQTRPNCPSCGKRKYMRTGCNDRFHKIDHRTTRHLAPITPPTSARKGR